jgi:hypothetical protein
MARMETVLIVLRKKGKKEVYVNNSCVEAA